MDWMRQLKNQTTCKETLKRLRDKENEGVFQKLLIQNEGFFLNLLNNENGKIRKFTAQLLASTHNQDYRDILLSTYLNEQQLMLRSALANCLKGFDLSDLLPILEKEEERVGQLLETEMVKHHKEELTTLRQLLKPYRTLPIHSFTGLKNAVPMILLMPAGHQEALIDELTWLESKKVSLGVSVKTSDLERLYENRLFSGIYFPLCKIPELSKQSVVQSKVAKRLLKFLDECHDGDFAYRIRVDCLEGRMAKEIAETLEIESKQRLKNYPGDYEIEIRLRENKEKQALVYVKLLTIQDERFAYRQHISSSSLAGPTAALIMYYLQDYGRPDGQVLDPLCNDGTLLIERCLRDEPHFVMGLDISDDLMNKAKLNTHKAGVDIRFVQRDLKTFTHKRKFDELMCVLPSLRFHDGQDNIEHLYKTLIKKSKDLVLVGGVVALYTPETKLVENLVNSTSHLKLLRKIPMIGKNYLYIFEVLGE